MKRWIRYWLTTSKSTSSMWRCPCSRAKSGGGLSILLDLVATAVNKRGQKSEISPPRNLYPKDHEFATRIVHKHESVNQTQIPLLLRGRSTHL